MVWRVARLVVSTQQTIPPNLGGSTGKLRPSCVRLHVLHCPFFRQHLHSGNVRSPSVDLALQKQKSGVPKEKKTAR